MNGIPTSDFKTTFEYFYPRSLRVLSHGEYVPHVNHIEAHLEKGYTMLTCNRK